MGGEIIVTRLSGVGEEGCCSGREGGREESGWFNGSEEGCNRS